MCTVTVKVKGMTADGAHTLWNGRMILDQDIGCHVPVLTAVRC